MRVGPQRREMDFAIPGNIRRGKETPHRNFFDAKPNVGD